MFPTESLAGQAHLLSGVPSCSIVKCQLEGCLDCITTPADEAVDIVQHIADLITPLVGQVGCHVGAHGQQPAQEG